MKVIETRTRVVLIKETLIELNDVYCNVKVRVLKCESVKM